MEHIKHSMFVCEKCGKELDRRKGQWIKRWNEKGLISGYHISSLMASHLSADFILKEQKDKPEQQFTNMILGEPYVGGGNYLPRHVLFGNLSPRENPQDCPPVIGVDTGKNKHYVVGNQYGIFFRDYYKDYEPIEKILKNDSRAICIIDRGGDETAPRQLLEKYPGQVYLCTFVQSQDVAPKWKEDIGYVNVDRDKLIQLVVDEFTAKYIPIFGTEEQWSEYADHWQRLYREMEEDAHGRRKYVWNTRKPDHYAFATLYWRIGMNKLEGGEGELIMPGQNQSYLGYDTETGKLTKATLKAL